jgi:hypothetical protein
MKNLKVLIAIVAIIMFDVKYDFNWKVVSYKTSTVITKS